MVLIIDGDKKRTALITGGSSGIGLELAKLFAKDGYRLILVAKPREELKIAKEILLEIEPQLQIVLRTQDLAVQGSAKQVYEFTKKQDIPVDVLVNCAGFGTYGFVNDIDMKRELEMLQLHVGSLYHLTRLYLQDMIKRDEGHVINMSSITAFQPNPNMATYGASKSFILQFSRALNYELDERGSRVNVLAVCPTAVRGTGFQKIARMEQTNTFNSWIATTPDIVARDTYRAMQHEQEIVVPGKGLRLLQSLIGRLPTSWLMRISRTQLQ